MNYLLLSILLLSTTTALADVRITYACKKLSRMSAYVYKEKQLNNPKIPSIDELDSIHDPLERLAITIGLTAASEPLAYTNMYTACLHYNHYPQFNIYSINNYH